MNQLEKHQKAIGILGLILILEHRIESNQKIANSMNWDYNKSWLLHRVAIDTKILERLQNYYNNNFKI
jgi:hypothetical protein